MIYDRIDNLAKYSTIPQVDGVLDFLSRTDVFALKEGDIPIRGDDLYVKVLIYDPKPAAENHFETHKRYTDVQAVFRGVEEMQVTARENLADQTQYDEKFDYQFFSATGDVSSIIVGAGEFVVFSPGEAHKPGCRLRESEDKVVKLVFKIRT